MFWPTIIVRGGMGTNVDEFLSVRKGKLVANGGHDRLLACVEICVAMWNIRVTTAILSLQKCGIGVQREKVKLPLEGEDSAEDELLPPKMEDIVDAFFLSLFFF
jgi:hypothetical protein